MLSYYPNYCSDCSDLKELLLKLDKKISKQIKKRWNQKKFLADNTFCKKEYKKLLYYRRITEHLQHNSQYFGTEFDLSNFISKVKILIK